MMEPRERCPVSDGGFAMVETLSALMLTAFMSSAIIAALWQASVISTEAATRTGALLLARAAWNAPCDQQAIEGNERFSVEVSSFRLNQASSLVMVEVNVAWRTANRARDVQLRGVKNDMCANETRF